MTRTTEKLEFTEYRIEYRYGPRIPEAYNSRHDEWQDASGFNNPTSTDNHLPLAHAQITRMRRKLVHYRYTGVEFRILSRRVTRTEWKQVNVDA